jgi:uncharacterized RDD family membrane protein YckC
MNETLPTEETILPGSEVKFATFWNRVGASLIDGFIISVVVVPVTYYNVINWKIPVLFIITSMIEIIYKPFLEYRYGATLGKMFLGLRVVGHSFGNVTVSEELRRVSFYMLPSILKFILMVRLYFSPVFRSISNYNAYSQYEVSSNPATAWIALIVSFVGIADCITFFLHEQRRSLHDLYAGTYVIEKQR